MVCMYGVFQLFQTYVLLFGFDLKLLAPSAILMMCDELICQYDVL